MKTRALPFLFLMFLSCWLYAQETCTLLNSGALTTLNNSDWSCTGGPNNPSEITDDGLGSVIIPNGISLDINVNPAATWSTSLTIQSGGTLTLSKRLELSGADPCGYTLIIDNGGSLIVPTGPPGQTRLYICGNYVIGVNGNPAYTATPPETISGPQVIDDLGGTLPIELIYFTGNVRNQTILLNWATSSEDNFHFFTIERSSDGHEFYPITDIEGSGGLEKIQEYKFTDEAPLAGINYYRIKAIDYDGTFEYHPIIGVNFERTYADKILIYPNPVTDHSITVRTNFSFKKAQIRIINLQGVMYLIALQSFPAQTFELPADLSPGLYIVEFITGYQVIKNKIIIK